MLRYNEAEQVAPRNPWSNNASLDGLLAQLSDRHKQEVSIANGMIHK